jgi:hypothetical protein
MKVEVSAGIEELKRQFSTSFFAVREDNQGGAYIVMEPVTLGPKYRPAATWIGFQIRTLIYTQCLLEQTLFAPTGWRSSLR